MVLLRFAKIVAAAALFAVVMAGDMTANESPRMLRSADDTTTGTGTTETSLTQGGTDDEDEGPDELSLIRAAIMRMEAKRAAEAPEEDEELGDDDVMKMQAEPGDDDEDEDVLMNMQAVPDPTATTVMPDPTATTVMPDPTATTVMPAPTAACHRGTSCYAKKMHEKKLQAKKKAEAQKKVAGKKPHHKGKCPPCPCSKTKKSLAQVHAKKCPTGHPCHKKHLVQIKCRPGHPCNKKYLPAPKKCLPGHPCHKKVMKKPAPTTTAPTTMPPTTAPPTTEAPTTAPPTTEAPTTAPPTTEAPTTAPSPLPAH